jgi:hypothetical protein
MRGVVADSCDGLAISSSHKAALADLQPEVSGPVRGQIAACGEKILGRCAWRPAECRTALQSCPPGGRKHRETGRDESGQLRSVVVGPLLGFKAVASLVLRVWEMAGMRKYRSFADGLTTGINRALLARSGAERMPGAGLPPISFRLAPAPPPFSSCGLASRRACPAMRYRRDLAPARLRRPFDGQPLACGSIVRSVEWPSLFDRPCTRPHNPTVARRWTRWEPFSAVLQGCST